MKEIKVGQINFYINDYFGDTGEYRIKVTCDKLNIVSNNYKYVFVDCKTCEADIVFYSLYNSLDNLKNIKGSPILIYWTDEYLCPGTVDKVWDNPFEYYRNRNLSISFYDDSENNLFFPYAFQFYDDYVRMKQYFNNSYIGRNKFCTFCASNSFLYDANYRNDIVKYISEQYKEITCCGSVMNNTNNEYLPWDVKERLDYHKEYKFNLCFENTYSSGNIIYFTEKMMNAFVNNVIPIYWGAERVTEIINPNSFINCNGLNKDEILKTIIEIDNNNELYDYMINQPIFVNNEIDYSYFYIKNLDRFISEHL